LQHGFYDFVRGHHIRIHNPWGHNPEALRKSHATTKKLYEDGLIHSWKKGLTKDTDERVAAIGRKASETINNNVSELERRSKMMRKLRLDGTIPTLYGKEHSQWKGGTSSLSGLCHSNNRLYNEWKFPKLKNANFRCEQCSSTDNLCVHHDGERMADIVRKISIENDYKGTDEEYDVKLTISELVTQYHIDNDVSGVVLCEECHKKIHPSLNFKTKI